jgi:2-dehydro-3-deoxyphosphooctonate aldolase (KDO 8-P synthase)
MILIAGPCVIENKEILFKTANVLKRLSIKLGITLFFKSSYDKANRTSISSFRGIGIDKGLQLLSEIKKEFDVPIVSDCHSVEEIEIASTVLDVIQIPAFLCRQTDLIISAGKTNKIVNVKKGQFLSPWDVKNIIEKFKSTDNYKLWITERGTSFGYNNLVVDMRSFPIIHSFDHRVLFDVTHSLQLPGGNGDSTNGQRQFALPLAKAAIAAGADGLFIETHPDPKNALCDASVMLPLDEMEGFLRQCVKQYSVNENLQ